MPGAAPDATLPRSRRLRSRRDYARVQRQGVRAATDALVLLGRSMRPGQGRLGLTVSKKVGGAVARNLVKRRLRHIFRENKAWFDARDLIVIAQPGAAELAFDALAALAALTVQKLDEAMARAAPRGRSRPR